MREWTSRCGSLIGLGLALAACVACGDRAAQTASVSGDVLPFHLVPDGRLAGARVSILEHPERAAVITGEDGHFRFDDLEVGSEVTLVMEHPDYHLIQTGTHRVPEDGLERLTFQAVTNGIYDALAIVVGVVPDEARFCQMPTTVTRFGKSMYDRGAHGQAGATVTIDPPLPAENGPIYFNERVLPDRALTETSEDGGVLFLQVPPGDYVLTAHAPGLEIKQVKMRCRAGVLVNASPPFGLQVLTPPAP